MERAKGTKDFLFKEKILRDIIIERMKEVFELYGFNPIETPILERFEVIARKYAGGNEILKETFKLRDQGNRELALRYDLTVPLARVICSNPQLKIPFKRYQIGRAFRDGPVEKGRVREFWQLDADIIGVKSIKADVEIINLTLDIFKKLNLDVIVRVNNRKVLNGILEYFDIENREDIIISIDKLGKLREEEVKKELKEKGLKEELIEKLFQAINIKGSNEVKLKKLRKILAEDDIKEIEELLESLGNKIVFDISLARGLAYYTGTIFEVFLKDVNYSLAAGGRYDDLIKNFSEEKIDLGAVGISFGLDRIAEFVKEEKENLCKVFVIPIKTFKESLRIIEKLRENGINTDYDLLDRGISKNLDYANKLKIPFVLIVGEKELRQGKVKLRDMESGKESLLKIEEVVKRLKRV